MAARVRPAPLVEDADPDCLPEHDLPGQRRLRRRDRVEGVLRPQRQDPEPRGGGSAGRHPGGSGALGSRGTPACGARTPADGAARDGPAGPHHARGLRAREQGAAAEAGGRARTRRPEPEGAVLHELRQATARRPLRLVHGLRRRSARAHVDQPQGATGRARCDREVVELDRCTVGCARRSRPARRPSARDGRREQLPQVAVQPRRARRATTGLVVQTVRARDGAASKASHRVRRSSRNR